MCIAVGGAVDGQGKRIYASRSLCDEFKVNRLRNRLDPPVVPPRLPQPDPDLLDILTSPIVLGLVLFVVLALVGIEVILA